MLQHVDVPYLPALSGTRHDRVTFIATHPLSPCVVAVPEDRFEVVLRRESSPVRREFVTYAARRDLAVGRMAGVAIIMAGDADGDRLCGTGGTMTRCTTVGRPALTAVVNSVVKLHIEPLVKARGERLHRRLLRIEGRVADRAHRTILVRYGVIDELPDMASDA